MRWAGRPNELLGAAVGVRGVVCGGINCLFGLVNGWVLFDLQCIKDN